MSAAVAARQQQQSGSAAHGGGSNSNSRMGTSSPVDSKRSNVKNEDKSSRPSSASSSYNQRDSSKIGSPKSTSHSQSHPASNTSSSIHPPQVAVNQPPDNSSSAPNPANPASGSPSNQHAKQAPRSLPPPPPPGQSQRDTPSDYFNINHHSRLDQEPNVFEQSFASNSGTTPNDPLATPKAILPPVTAITSPASLLPGHLNWVNSLRSGPLSPAMLQGPASNSNGVSSGSLGFDSHIRTGLTPNESGIRSGLTPGGSGSLFSAPQNAMFQFVGSGGATPGTMEFHKTAIAAARKSQPPLNTSQHISVKPEENTSTHDHDQQKPRQHSDPYHASDPAHSAASGLFLLAQAQHQQGDSAAVSIAGSNSGYQNSNQLSSGLSGSNGGSIESSSPNLIKRAVVNSANNVAMSGSINRSVSGGSMANSVRGISEISDDYSDSGGEGEMQTSTNSSSRNTRARKLKGTSSTTGRRKAEDQSPSGGRSQQNKKTKGNQGQSVSGGSDDGNDGMDGMDDNQTGKDGKKMTDEEKRKNFLERNRVAALKCRQRKKQWLANLQTKVELYSSENDALTAQVTALREEIMSLKTLLLAHKDCPVAIQNGLNINVTDITSNMTVSGEFSHVPMMAANYRMQMGNNGGSNGMGGSMMGPPGGGRSYDFPRRVNSGNYRHEFRDVFD